MNIIPKRIYLYVCYVCRLVPFCQQCGNKFTLWVERFCFNCGFELQQNEQKVGGTNNHGSIGITDTKGSITIRKTVKTVWFSVQIKLTYDYFHYIIRLRRQQKND